MWTTEQVAQVSFKGSVPHDPNMSQLVEKAHPDPSHIPVRKHETRLGEFRIMSKHTPLLSEAGYCRLMLFIWMRNYESQKMLFINSCVA